MKKEQKQELISELHKKFESAQATILTEYKGLTVAEITELRNELRKGQLEYRVVKNTLAIRAAVGTSAEKLKDFLEGPTGLVFGYGDPVTPAKTVIEYAKKRAKLKVKAGMIEGQLADATMLKAVASLPSRDELLSRMAAGFQAPASQLARLLSATVARLGYALSALQEKNAQQLSAE
ncbi:MAG: 50S ribosomal protein L10 [Nitrospirota bacterium]